MVEISKYKNKIFPLKERVPEYYKKFKGLLRDTALEVYIAASVGAFSAGLISYNHESDKGKLIPLAFSEIEQIERDAVSIGIKTPPMTKFLASTNDLSMKVFECWNDSHEKTIFGDNTRAFALELENRIDPTFKTHKYEIIDFTKNLSSYADNALSSIESLFSVKESLPSMITNFENSWNHKYKEYGHYEPRLKTTIDGDGDVSTTVEMEYVYDHTIHKFNYFKQYGESASNNLNKIISNNKEFGFKENLMTSRFTHAENEYAIEKSRKKELEGKRLPEKNLLNYSSNWAYGSTIFNERSMINNLWECLILDASKWNREKNTSHSIEKKTYSNKDAGPTEYQTVQTSIEHGKELKKHLDNVINSIEFVKQKSPLLENKIKEFVSVVFDKRDGDADDLKDEIMSLTKQMYKSNFSGGFDVEPFKISNILLWMLCGSVIGMGLGFGADYLGKKFNWYTEKNKKLINY